MPLGTCLELSWDIAGEVSRVSLFYNNGVIWDYAPVRGNTTHCPPKEGVAGYNITATGPGGKAEAWQYADVQLLVAQPLPAAQ